MANGSWRIARTRNGAHLPLIIVVALAVALILIGKAQSSLVRSRARTCHRLDGACSPVRAPAGRASTAGWARSARSSPSINENLKLKEENARLRQWHNAAIVLEDRVQRYQLLLHAVPDPALSSVVARSSAAPTIRSCKR